MSILARCSVASIAVRLCISRPVKTQKATAANSLFSLNDEIYAILTVFCTARTPKPPAFVEIIVSSVHCQCLGPEHEATGLALGPSSFLQVYDVVLYMPDVSV